jgi:hypothetical protein
MAYAAGFASAVDSAFAQWKVTATVRGIRIFGPSAVGGRLTGQSLGALIRLFAPRGDDRQRIMTDKLASAVNAKFRAARMSFAIPGLPFYPAFAAWPGPMAPPMPNVPYPLLACMALPSMPSVSGTPDMAMTLPIAAQLGWLRLIAAIGGTMIQRVLGKGPVPSFAPPYVPIGPVVAGDNIAIPGNLL